MSAVAAHYSVHPDRRYHDLPHYDPSTFFQYSQPSLNAVTAHSSSSSVSSLDPGYPLATSAPASYAVWNAHAHESTQSSSYSTSSSSSLAANTNSYSSSSPSAHSGPSSLSNLSAYPPDYTSHRSLVPTRPASYHPPAPSSSPSSTLSSPPLRPSYTSGTRSYSSLAAAAAAASTSPSAASSRLQNATWDNAALYTIEPSDPISNASLSSSSPAPSPPPTPIKAEDPEGEFFIEVSVPPVPVTCTMPEVPLRATHALPEQKSMMCVFRLDSFAMHDGIRSAATQPGPGGVEVGPLKERPLEIEWQVQLDTPLVEDEEDSFRYRTSAVSKTHGNAMQRTSVLYRDTSPVSPRPSGRAGYSSTGSASPALSLEYSPVIDNEPWDGSSGYESVTDNSSAPGCTSTASPTFTSVITPAQSLGWGLRYQAAEVDIEPPTTYRRPQSIQSSLSRVSQPHGQYLLSGGSRSLYQQQQPQYSAYDDVSNYSRSGSGGRYGDMYPSSSSSSSAQQWYRSS